MKSSSLFPQQLLNWVVEFRVLERRPCPEDIRGPASPEEEGACRKEPASLQGTVRCSSKSDWLKMQIPGPGPDPLAASEGRPRGIRNRHHALEGSSWIRGCGKH